MDRGGNDDENSARLLDREVVDRRLVWTFSDCGSVVRQPPKLSIGPVVAPTARLDPFKGWFQDYLLRAQRNRLRATPTINAAKLKIRPTAVIP